MPAQLSRQAVNIKVHFRIRIVLETRKGMNCISKFGFHQRYNNRALAQG